MSLEAALGRTHRDIARRHNVCQKTVQRALRRARETYGDDGLGELRDYWLRIEVAIEELGILRLGSPGPRIRMSAIRMQEELMRKRLQTMSVLGVLPPAGAPGDTPIEGMRAMLVKAARRDGLGQRFEDWLNGQLGGPSKD